MVAEAKARGLALTGPDGLLKLFAKNVLETALNEEMTEHLGHEKLDDFGMATEAFESEIAFPTRLGYKSVVG